MAIDVKRHVASSVFDTAACKEGAVLGHRGGVGSWLRWHPFISSWEERKKCSTQRFFTKKRPSRWTWLKLISCPFFRCLKYVKNHSKIRVDESRGDSAGTEVFERGGVLWAKVGNGFISRFGWLVFCRCQASWLTVRNLSLQMLPCWTEGDGFLMFNMIQWRSNPHWREPTLGVWLKTDELSRY